MHRKNIIIILKLKAIIEEQIIYKHMTLLINSIKME